MTVTATRPTTSIGDVAAALRNKTVITVTVNNQPGWYVTAVNLSYQAVTVRAGGRSLNVAWDQIADVTIG